MIPSRPTSAASSAPKDTVTSRLGRLRSEHSASSRPSFRSSTPTQSSTAPRWLEGALSPAPLPSPRRAYGRRGTAGPPAPASWTAQAALGVNGRSSAGTFTQPLALVERRKLAEPLQKSGKEEKEGPASLFIAAGKVVAADLAEGKERSLLLEHVAYLPNHLRLRLFDVFADWRNAAPLTSEGAVELLRLDVSDGLEVEAVGAGDAAGKDAGTDKTDVEEVDKIDVEEEDDEDGWDTSGLGGEGTSLEDLTSLDLSFCAVSLRTLRQLLLHPASSTTPLVSSPKLLPTFPLLHSLNLTSTPRIAFTDTFFDLLTSLISLRTLSLCGKTLDAPTSAVTAATFLPRLSAATPNLVSLDLSFVEPLTHVAVKGVDWDSRWLYLRVLGLRRELVDVTGEEVGPEKKESIRKEVWQHISVGRKKKRRWIDIVV